MYKFLFIHFKILRTKGTIDFVLYCYGIWYDDFHRFRLFFQLLTKFRARSITCTYHGWNWRNDDRAILYWKNGGWPPLNNGHCPAYDFGVSTHPLFPWLRESLTTVEQCVPGMLRTRIANECCSVFIREFSLSFSIFAVIREFRPFSISVFQFSSWLAYWNI